MIHSPFPSFAAFEVVTGEDLDDFVLFPEESVALSPRAVAARRRHFSLGRCAARRAVRALIGATPPIARAKDGRPLWPAGVVGAITHTDDTGAAVVARTEDCHGLGLDIEGLDRVLKSDISRLVCSDAERVWVQAADPDRRVRMIFSAKEAVFKALYPLEQIFLGFQDAELTWDDSGWFDARLQKDAARLYPSGTGLRVRCEIHGDLIVSSVVAG